MCLTQQGDIGEDGLRGEKGDKVSRETRRNPTHTHVHTHVKKITGLIRVIRRRRIGRKLANRKKNIVNYQLLGTTTFTRCDLLPPIGQLQEHSG